MRQNKTSKSMRAWCFIFALVLIGFVCHSLFTGSYPLSTGLGGTKTPAPVTSFWGVLFVTLGILTATTWLAGFSIKPDLFRRDKIVYSAVAVLVIFSLAFNLTPRS